MHGQWRCERPRIKTHEITVYSPTICQTPGPLSARNCVTSAALMIAKTDCD